MIKFNGVSSHSYRKTLLSTTLVIFEKQHSKLVFDVDGQVLA